MRGVAPGRVDLPRTRRSGFSATIGFIMVVALLLVGGSLAISGGGGILSGGGRFFAEATPTPTPAPAAVDNGDGAVASAAPIDEDEDVPKAKTANMATFSCANGSIKDLSRGSWVLSDVNSEPRETEDGEQYDQIYWKLSRQNVGKKIKAAKATAVKMLWTTPEAVEAKHGALVGDVLGDRALEIVFDGPVRMSFDSSITQSDLEDDGIDQLRSVRLFEKNGKARAVVGMNSDSCARLGSTNWGAKKIDKENARVLLDVERFD